MRLMFVVGHTWNLVIQKANLPSCCKGLAKILKRPPNIPSRTALSSSFWRYPFFSFIFRRTVSWNALRRLNKSSSLRITSYSSQLLVALILPKRHRSGGVRAWQKNDWWERSLTCCISLILSQDWVQIKRTICYKIIEMPAKDAYTHCFIVIWGV